FEARSRARDAVCDDLALREHERRVTLRLTHTQDCADTVVGTNLRPLAVEDRVRVENEVATAGFLALRCVVDDRRRTRTLVETERRDPRRCAARRGADAADERSSGERRCHCRRTSTFHVHSSPWLNDPPAD